MSKGIKQLSIFFVLLCIVLIQVAFVSGKEVNGNATVSNATVSNATVNVFKPQNSTPDISLQTSYISDALEAGNTYVYNVQIKNLDDKTITIEPKLSAGYPITQAGTKGQAFGDDAVKIVAPKTIQAGEIANMTITITVPENATGSYHSSIVMNVNGEKNKLYNPLLGLSFTVKESLTVPYVKTFSTTTDAPVTIDVAGNTINSNMGIRILPKIEDPSFQLGLTCNGNPVDLTPSKRVISGAVYVGNYYPSWLTATNANYQIYSENSVETYKANGAIGDYKLSILPKNTNYFGYSITIGNST
jgi:hypothetical protein